MTIIYYILKKYNKLIEGNDCMKYFKKKSLPEQDTLMAEIKQTKLALETAYSNFENSIDPDLIDSYIYEVNAVQKRYKFLLRQAKNLENENFAV